MALRIADDLFLVDGVYMTNADIKAYLKEKDDVVLAALRERIKSERKRPLLSEPIFPDLVSEKVAPRPAKPKNSKPKNSKPKNSKPKNAGRRARKS